MNANQLLQQMGSSASRHVDPSKFSFEELAPVRGAMWTARLNLPWGPRPNQDSNILPMDFYEYFGTKDRKRMIGAYRGDRGLTHAVTGPMVDLGGYHGLWPSTNILEGGQPLWDWYLDAMQEWWDAGITPVHFAHPDGWSLDDMQLLLKYYRQPRAQRLLRVIVWTGWEPTRYDWTNAYWNSFLEQAWEIMPHALKVVHTVGDVDALTGGDDYRTNPPQPGGNATCWQYSAPLLHVWFNQWLGYFSPIMDRDDPRWQAQYEAFKINMPNEYRTSHTGSLASRFRAGYNGWPTHSAWSGGRPLRLVDSEQASYPDTWMDWPESEAIELGNLAMAAGADGYLDGGSVDVPKVTLA